MKAHNLGCVLFYFYILIQVHQADGPDRSYIHD